MQPAGVTAGERYQKQGMRSINLQVWRTMEKSQLLLVEAEGLAGPWRSG
jgi:hypothetical protein